MNFFANIRIRTIGWIFIGILAIVAGAFVASTMATVQNLGAIQSTWVKFEENRSEKAHALSALRREIGYGGMIHAFKNYVLRQSPELITQTRKKLGAAYAALDHYQTFELSPEEQIATRDIRAMLDAYSFSLDQAIVLANEQKGPSEIDPVVKVDDGPAIAGLATLEQQASSQASKRGRQASKAQLLTELRRAMGYGGIIHDFKNAVLRGSARYFEDAQAKTDLANQVMQAYLAGPVNRAEQLAIAAINTVVKKYEKALPNIRLLRREGKSIREIDATVKVDDTPALEAFETLTREIVRQNDLEARRVDAALKRVSEITRLSAFGATTMIVILGLGAIWLMRKQVLQPIRRQTEVMTKMAAGDYEIDIPGVEQRNELGEMAQALAVFKLTAIERARAERVITQFKTTLDATKDCIFMFWPEDMQFFYVNQGAIQQVGYSEHELLQMTPMDLKPYYDEGRFRELIRPLMKGPTTSMTFETVHQHKSGREVPVEIGLQYIAPADEKPRFVAIVRDITERRKADKAKSEFISTVSHELRTPLTSIKGALGLVQSSTLGVLPDKLQNMIDIALRNCNRLVLLINDILDLEKLEAGKMTFRMEPTELTALVDEAVTVNQAYAEEHGVTLKANFSPRALWVDGDKDRIMQVLANLLSNAAKFSPAGSEVSVTVSGNDHEVTISVQDHGVGIPEEFSKSLFDKFTQADASDTKQSGGTGLGLSISKAILQRHGGTIDFESEIGHGTTFYCTLPLLREGAPRRNQEQSKRSGNRILICEDEADIAMLLELMLRNAGYQTARAADAKSAKQMLMENHFDAMTLDLKLPDQHGISLLQELRKMPTTREMPIIVVSATADQERNRLNGDALDVIDWIEKPIDANLLMERLAGVFKSGSHGKPKILHVEDDHHIVEIVGTLVGEKAEVLVAETLIEARALIANDRFDLVLLDLMLPDGDGESLFTDLKANAQGTVPVVVFSARDLKTEVADKVEAALVKSQATNDELLKVIQTAIDA